MRVASLFGAGLLGVMVGVVATSALRKPPAPETRFISFDANSKPSLIAGWSDPEGQPGDSFAWCAARVCEITVNVTNPSDRVIAFQAAPFEIPNAAQSVKVSVNKASLGNLPMPPGASVLRAVAPKAVWKLGTNVVTFDFAYAESPKDHSAENQDDRHLAASFLWLGISGS
jgi:hypothetical protein